MPTNRRIISKGPLFYHPPMDNSCESLDREQIPYGSSHFEQGLLEDMRICDQSYLELHYPELIFGFHDDRKEPKNRDFRVKLLDARGRCRGWRWGSWRTK